MRIIGDIDDKFVAEAAPAEEKKPKINRYSWVKYAAAAACAAVILAAGFFAVTQRGDIISEPPDIGQSGGYLQGGNPYADFDTLEQAEAAAGLSIEIPESCGAYSDKSYFVIDERILEVRYSDTNGKSVISIRKSADTEDISGDFNTYKQISEIRANGCLVTIKGNDDKFYLAVWVSGEYSYSLSADNGISESEMKEIVEIIR